jgi:parvulin-like peptidyl-prolyl isomerase
MILPFLAVLLASDPVRVVEEIVAKVNNDIITRGQLESSQGDALRERIDQLLLLQKGKELDIKVDAEVTRQLAEYQVASKLSDPDRFREWVRETSGGVPYEEVRQNLLDRAMTRKVIAQEVGSRIVVSQAEIQKYYDEHKSEFIRQETVFLRELLIAPADGSAAAWEAARKKAEGIALRARTGEKFEQLVRGYSAAESARIDGDLGGYKKGQMVKELEEKVFSQSRGSVTDAIRTANGYLILKVEDRYADGQASLTDVRDEIMERLYRERLDPALRAYLTKLREEAFLEIRAGYVDARAAPGKDTSWKDAALLTPETTTKEEVAARKHKKKVMGLGVPFAHCE